MKLSQIVILAYGVLYFVLAAAMEAENINHSYPLVYVGFSMASQILIVSGVLIFGLHAEAGFAQFWRCLFPFMVLEFMIGLWFDATIPPDALKPEWAFNIA